MKEVYGGFLLGSAAWIKEKLAGLQDQVERTDIAHKRAIRNVVEPERIVRAVSQYYKQPEAEVCKGKPRPQVAKQRAVYLKRRKTGLSNREIGDIFGMKAGAVSFAGLAMEKRVEEEEASQEALRNKLDS